MIVHVFDCSVLEFFAPMLLLPRAFLKSLKSTKVPEIFEGIVACERRLRSTMNFFPIVPERRKGFPNLLAL